MTTKLTVTAGIRVEADQQEVWDLVTDWAEQGRWIWATTTEGGHGLGAQVHARTAIGPFGFADPMVITEWDPPNRCTVAHQGKIVRGSGSFDVRKLTGSAAELRWTERMELPLPPAVGKPLARALIGPVTRVGLGSSLRRFATLVRAHQGETRS